MQTVNSTVSNVGKQAGNDAVVPAMGAVVESEDEVEELGTATTATTVRVKTKRKRHAYEIPKNEAESQEKLRESKLRQPTRDSAC